jgi:predicted amidohydrolase
MKVLQGNKEANLNRAVEMIRQAGKGGAAVVLLPEVMDLGWGYPASPQEADLIPYGRTCRVLSRTARKERLYVCSGLVERRGSAVYNSAVLIDPQGRVLLAHRKINELAIGHSVYGPGDCLNVCQTPLATFGLMICADATAKDHVLSRSLCYMGADVILSPSAWAVPPEHDNAKEPYGSTWSEAYGPVSEEFGVWIAGCSNTGTVDHGGWKGWKCIGSSMVTGPDGREVLKGPYGGDAETLLYADITPVPRPARGTDWWEWWGTRKRG